MISKKSILTFSDQAMVSSGNFLTILLGALYLPLDEQGILVAFMSIYFFFLIMSNALIYAPFASLYCQIEDKLSYFYKLSKFSLLVSLLFVLIFIFLFSFWDVVTIDSVSLFAGFIFFQQVADYLRRVSYSIGESHLAALSSFMLYVPRMGAILLTSPNKLDDFLLILLLSSLISFSLSVYFYIVFFVRKSNVINVFSLKEHFSFAKNIVYAAPIGWSVAYIPTLVLASLVGGSVMVGILGTLRSIVGLTNVFMEMIEVASLPKLSLLFKAERFDEINRFFFSVSAFFVVFLGSFALVIFLYYDDVAMVFRPEFSGFRSIMLLLVLAYFIYFVGRFYVLYFRVFLNSQPEFYYAIFSFVFMLLFLPLIYYIGILGSAIVYCCVPLAAFFATYYKFKFKVS